jgi:hypothetical protein
MNTTIKQNSLTNVYVDIASRTTMLKQQGECIHTIVLDNENLPALIAALDPEREKKIAELEKEVERLKEFEWIYNDLSK